MRFGAATASAFHGSATRAAPARIAHRAAKICATSQASPAIRSTAATPNTRSPTAAIVSGCRKAADAELAPWLCAGLIGYRALKQAGNAKRVGIYGFGAAAHIVAQVARYEGREIYA